MEESERKYWFKFWNRTAFGMGKLAKFAHCVNLANQLQMHDIPFDIHIQKVTPSFAGALTTLVTGLHEFNDIEDLDILLSYAVETTKAGLSSEKQDEGKS